MFVGDFMQLPPTNRYCLTQTCVTLEDIDCKKLVRGWYKHQSKKKKKKDPSKIYGKLSTNTLSRQGATLFALSKLIRLTIQNRCASDSQHVEFVEKMGGGEKVTEADLHNFRELTKEDVVQDESWKFAPILVSTN